VDVARAERPGIALACKHKDTEPTTQGVDEIRIRDEVEARKGRITQVGSAKVRAVVMSACRDGRRGEADCAESQQECFPVWLGVGRTPDGRRAGGQRRSDR
jgi:hypothetical protein